MQPWVLEINSNPSFNINIQTFHRVHETEHDYKLRTEVSEIDKFIKSKVITDAFKALLDDSRHVGGFKRLFPSASPKKDKWSKY